MAGLREAKKRDTRQRILESARRMFGEKGYALTTTAAIARDANIGEGTLFNYYRTKGELFVAAVFEGYRPEKYVPAPLAAVNEATLADETLNLLKHYFRGFAHIDKRTLKEYFAVMYGNDVESDLLMGTVFRVDEAALGDLRGFYGGLQDSGKLPPSFDTELAVGCIYGFVASRFMLYAYTDGYTFDGFMDDLGRAVRFILHGHVPNWVR